MTHSLVLEVPEEIYKSLSEEAALKNRGIEEIALEKLANKELIPADPLDKFVGTIKSDVPDWADNHDKYLGGELVKDLSIKQ